MDEDADEDPALIAENYRISKIQPPPIVSNTQPELQPLNDSLQLDVTESQPSSMISQSTSIPVSESTTSITYFKKYLKNLMSGGSPIVVASRLIQLRDNHIPLLHKPTFTLPAGTYFTDIHDVVVGVALLDSKAKVPNTETKAQTGNLKNMKKRLEESDFIWGPLAGFLSCGVRGLLLIARDHREITVGNCMALLSAAE
ncbi:hypothetical protein DFH28DRAFT_922252 [Melampsora americana]|nr:hypothetical protein DFH28DRAFT_922252 [Melampsora americana]